MRHHVLYAIHMKMAADKLVNPIVKLSDYGPSLLLATEHAPEIHTPPLSRPPEDFFQEPITLAADIRTLGVGLYEVLGERPLFESFNCDRDDILADTITTLGLPPARWWDLGRIARTSLNMMTRNIQRIYTPVLRPLHQRMRDMGRGKTPETCEWDVEAGEMRALEEVLRVMLAWSLLNDLRRSS